MPSEASPLHVLRERLTTRVQTVSPVKISGLIAEVAAGQCRVRGLSGFVRIGDRVAIEIEPAGDRQPGQTDALACTVLAEIVRIGQDDVLAKPLAARHHAKIGLRVALAPAMRLAPCDGWKGRVVDALCAPLDGIGPLPSGTTVRSVDGPPPDALARAKVSVPIRTGVKLIDLFTPLCLGQRIGIFAGSGVGKSTLLGMLAHAEGFDTIVIALVGERGREVREFVEDTLGANAARAVVVVSTGDEGPMLRSLAPRTATAIAEHFRDRGQSVLLIVDSVTRYAHAARDVALAAGEAPVARGYPPSVFSDLPRLLERSGPGIDGSGTITAVYSVLVDGDDHNDPVADAIRGTLDGHVVLDRAIAEEGRYPAIDVLRSVSRLARHALAPDQQILVRKLRAMIARFEDTRDLRAMGGYQRGGDADLDQAVLLVPKLQAFALQTADDEPCRDVFRDLADALQQTV